MACAMCEAREERWQGGDGKRWDGDPPLCGFFGGYFTSDNFNCATLNALRRLAMIDPSVHIVSNDQVSATIPLDGNFLVMGWYKRRGRTEYVGLLMEDDLSPATEATAIDFIRRVR